MVHLITPSSQPDYTNVDYWVALCRSDYIADYNWCEYAMTFLVDAISNAKQQIESNSHVINFYGCDMFSRVSYLLLHTI